MSETAKIYRGCAEQARLAAQATSHPDHRTIFEQLAQSYEAKAKGIEGPDSPPRGSQDTEAR